MGIFGREEPEIVEVLDKPLRCQVCSHDKFFTRKAQLQGQVLAFFNLDWASPTCTCVICSQCGYVHWFVPE